MSKEQNTEPGKPAAESQQKHYKVDIRNVEVLERAGGNLRIDYGDIEELAESIYAVGLQQPLIAYRHPEIREHWILVDGHRRHRAIMRIGEKYGVWMQIPIVTRNVQTLSDEEIVVTMMVTSEGKRLTALEMAEGVGRLLNYGLSTDDIVKKLGRGIDWVKSMEVIAKAPKRLKNLILEKSVSYTEVYELMRDVKDYNKAYEVLEQALNHAQQEAATKAEKTGKVAKARVTRKHIAAATNAVDSLRELRFVLRKRGLVGDDWKVESTDPVQAALIGFAFAIANDKLGAEAIEKMIWPEPAAKTA